MKPLVTMPCPCSVRSTLIAAGWLLMVSSTKDWELYLHGQPWCIQKMH